MQELESRHASYIKQALLGELIAFTGIITGPIGMIILLGIGGTLAVKGIVGSSKISNQLEHARKTMINYGDQNLSS